MADSRVGFATKFWFGFGQGAEGIKMGALTSILLFYYSQVLGLDPILTGFALLLGVVTDGISDAIIGSWSDSLVHRWGRRHPFMYAAALPFGVSFIALFVPPAGLGQWGLFFWLLGWVTVARNVMTLFVVPHYALGAELSEDHDERTNVVAFRAFFGYVGTTAVFLVGLWVLVPTAEYPTGQLDPANYPVYAVILGVLVSVMIFASALGTHGIIPELRFVKVWNIHAESFELQHRKARQQAVDDADQRSNLSVESIGQRSNRRRNRGTLRVDRS